MKEHCKSHPEQELVIIKFCPCCHEEFRGKWGGRVSMSSIARELIPIEPLPQGALPIYDRDIDVVGALIGDDDGDDDDSA